MAVGHSDDIDVVDAVSSVVDQCAQSLAGLPPTAGLLFCTYDIDLPPLIRGVRDAFPDIELVGTTAAGEMSSVLGFQEDSVMLALFASDSIDITAGSASGVMGSPGDAARRAVDQARGKTELQPRLCIAVPCITGDDPTILLRELHRALGDDVPVIGGGSAPRTAPGEPLVARQFHDDQILEDAASVLLFSGPLSYSFGIDTGWQPIGSKGTVTESAGNIILGIDDEPALSFYQRYLGPEGKPTPANPLAVFEDDGDDFYLRVPFTADAAGAIRLTGGVPADSAVQLTVAATDEIFAGTRSAVRRAVERFPEGSAPEAALVFSCAIRKLVLGTRTGTELDIARSELGDAVPVGGFYCFGEIAPIESGATRFHNETIVALLLGEAA
jgi:hypothetical protein